LRLIITLAVGISTTENTVHTENWYTEIEKLSQSSDLNYSRERYYETCNEVMIADQGIEVLGTMGTGRAPEVNIFIPINQLHINNDIQHIKFCTCVEKLQLR
jgi:hypothetical protein